jgi:hypothetical protein
MKADHGFMTVHYELDPTMQLPMVPVILNCTTPPLMTLRQSYDLGIALGEAIRSFDGLEPPCRVPRRPGRARTR